MRISRRLGVGPVPTIAVWLAPALSENPVHRGFVPPPRSADLGLVPIRHRLDLHFQHANVTGRPAGTTRSS
jgi:hypothetical protein